ncbi:MAG: glucosyl-3-phosphoglycerate synthase [Sciscionella sp.]|nr:glucosyl-3-phosphoglycerate synthase [Sciscionella sp.]
MDDKSILRFPPRRDGHSTGAPRRRHAGASSGSHGSSSGPHISRQARAAATWFADRTWQSPQWTVPDLLRAKENTTVAVVLPALNEESTVAGVVHSVLPYLGTLVDELVVLDSGSTDRTAELARAAGARVLAREEALPDVDVLPGKGEVLWRSLAATTSDVLVFLDADLIEPASSYVPALLGPLLSVPDIRLVKGFYRRPIRVDGQPAAESGGGRVTELLVRPLLDTLRPELSAVIQPIGGEYAARREFLESAPFAVSYGVDVGLLLDAHAEYGLAGLAQVNLGVRRHRNRSLLELGVMARQVLATALDRCGIADAGEFASYAQFVQHTDDGDWLPAISDVVLADRPPMREVLRERRLAGNG